MSVFVRRYAWWLLAAHGISAAALYSLAAHHPIRDPWIVHPSALDGQIPLIPAAAWLYATYILLLPALVAAARHRPGFDRVFVTGTVCALANAVIYILFPTSLDARTHAPAGTLLAAIQALDTTMCALPSGHVALPTSLAVAAYLSSRADGAGREAWRRSSGLFAVWTALLALSTVLTKQHYVVDVVAGALYGTAVAVVLPRLLELRRTSVQGIALDESPASLDRAA